MDSPIIKQIANFLQERKKHKHWLVIFTCMAVLVGLGTAAALKMMGQAMTRKEKVLNCSLEVHTHTDACRDEAGNLICGLADYVVHVHNDDCYDSDGNLVCTLPEIPPHVHSEECYTDEEVLVCGMEESEGHVHDETCYTQQVAGLQCQAPEHQHGTGCFDEEGNVICEMPEHQHTSECYDEMGNLICGQASHTHMASCYDEENNLICTLEEHQHTAECLAVEDVLTCELEEGTDGHQHTKECYETQRVLTCGQLELHTHTDECFEEVQSEDGEVTKQLVCTIPVLEEHVHSEEAGCFVIIEAAVDEVPEAVNGTEQPTEAVSSTEEAQPTEAVDETEMVGETETETETPEEFVKTYEDENYIVTATYTAKAKIPEEAELVVKQITAEDDEESYAEQEAKYQEAVGDENAVVSALLEIGFFIEDKEVQPKDNVTITVQLLGENGIPEGVPITVVHFADDGVEVLDGGKAEDGSTTFETGSFSPFVIGYSEEDVPSARNEKYDVPLVTDVKSTGEFVTINLYDYGSNINDLYYKGYTKGFDANKYDKDTSATIAQRGSTKYPVFQQDNGTQVASWTKSLIDKATGFNYGDNIVNDINAKGGREVTGKNSGNINSVRDGANAALNDNKSPVVSMLLNNNKQPQLSDGTSLGYLFSGEQVDGQSYAVKKNKNNLDGLFRYDEESGAYDFDSRVNHAEYDEATDKFKVYNALLTPNYMMYPFGNFMPFNKINTETTLASKIDDAYIAEVSNIAKKNGTEWYGKLNTSLEMFNKEMKDKYGGSWTAEKAINEYFTVRNWGQKNNWTIEQLNNLYNIDYDISKNFFFGMNMEMNFRQPKNGKTGNNNAYPMRFEFAGDDDVWVYVDGVLFLNLSGIHRHIAGSIDFQEGKVYYYKYDAYASNRDVKTIDGFKKIRATTKRDLEPPEVESSESFYDILVRAYGTTEGSKKAEEMLINTGTKEKPNYTTFKNYTTHNFKFYYMERGAGSSVCRINFNFPLLPKNSVSVYKELEMDAEHPVALGNPDFHFQVLKADDDQYTDQLFIGAETTYKIFKDGQDTGRTGTTNSEGVFTLKAGEMAVFEGIGADQGAYYVKELIDKNIYEQYGGRIEVDGKISTETDQGVQVGSDEFIGILSPIKQIDDGAVTAFNITNKVVFDKLGALEITKEVPASDRENLKPNQTFDFEVTLDGELLKEGTAYTVYKGNAKIEDRTVTTAGRITLQAGETAKIENILSGVQYTVKETSESSEGYIVIYEDITGKETDSVVTTDTPGEFTEEDSDTEVSGEPEDDTQSTEAGDISGEAEEAEADADVSSGLEDRGDTDTSNESGENGSHTADTSSGSSVIESRTFITGIISLDTAVKLKVTNTTGAAFVNISGTKTLENPDGKEHSYEFTLTRVKDQNGTLYGEGEDLDHPHTIKYTESLVTLPEGSKGFSFILPYETSQIEKDKLDSDGNVKFYYEIVEKIPDATDSSTKYDDSEYVVEVTVHRDSVGRLSAEVTGAFKDGVKIQDSEISFTNELLTDLTVIKIADRTEDQKVNFEFNIEITSSKQLDTAYTTVEKRQNNDVEKEGKISLTKGDGNVYTTSIKLKPGEYVTIKGLPYGITWKVTEVNTDGYVVYHVVEQKASGDIPAIAAKSEDTVEIKERASKETAVNSNTAEGEAADNTVTFMNIAMYKLPKTGGMGTTPYTMAGVLAMLGAGLLYRRKFRERRV